MAFEGLVPTSKSLVSSLFFFTSCVLFLPFSVDSAHLVYPGLFAGSCINGIFIRQNERRFLATRNTIMIIFIAYMGF